MTGSERHPLIFWTADRSALVEEGDARAAFLAYAWSDPIPPEHLALLGKPAADEPAPVKPLERMNKTELQAIAAENGLDTEGTNRELVNRIRAARKD